MRRSATRASGRARLTRISAAKPPGRSTAPRPRTSTDEQSHEGPRMCRHGPGQAPMSTGLTSHEGAALGAANPSPDERPSGKSIPAQDPALEASPSGPGFDWNRVLKVGLPLLLFTLSIWFWESYVTRNQVPAYIL